MLFPSQSFGVKSCADSKELVKKAQIIFIAVKPWFCRLVLEEVGPSLTADHVIVSIAAGMPLSALEVAPLPLLPPALYHQLLNAACKMLWQLRPEGCSPVEQFYDSGAPLHVELPYTQTQSRDLSIAHSGFMMALQGAAGADAHLIRVMVGPYPLPWYRLTKPPPFPLAPAFEHNPISPLASGFQHNLPHPPPPPPPKRHIALHSVSGGSWAFDLQSQVSA